MLYAWSTQYVGAISRKMSKPMTPHFSQIIPLPREEERIEEVSTTFDQINGSEPLISPYSVMVLWPQIGL